MLHYSGIATVFKELSHELRDFIWQSLVPLESDILGYQFLQEVWLEKMDVIYHTICIAYDDDGPFFTETIICYCCIILEWQQCSTSYRMIDVTIFGSHWFLWNQIYWLSISSRSAPWCDSYRENECRDIALSHIRWSIFHRSD